MTFDKVIRTFSITLGLLLLLATYTTSNTNTPVPAQTEAAARRIATLAALDKIQVVCPAFLDAPIGFKPCPAQDALDRAKAIAQDLR